MPMTVDLKTIYETWSSLDRLSKVPFEKEAIAFRVGMIREKVRATYEPLNKAYMKVFRKYAKEMPLADGRGSGQFFIPSGSDDEEKFDAEIADLFKGEIELRWDVLQLAELRAAMGKTDDNDDKAAFKPLPVLPVDLGSLSRWLITDSEPTEKKKAAVK